MTKLEYNKRHWHYVADHILETLERDSTKNPKLLDLWNEIMKDERVRPRYVFDDSDIVNLRRIIKQKADGLEDVDIEAGSCIACFKFHQPQENGVYLREYVCGGFVLEHRAQSDGTAKKFAIDVKTGEEVEV